METQPESASTTHHALVWRGKEDVRYQEVPRPVIVDPTDALIRVTATTICGSDLHMYSGAMPNMKSGDVLGHEFLGFVDKVGGAVSKLKVGDRVVVSFGIACGECDSCLKEEYTACKKTNPSDLQKNLYGHRTAAIFGYSHMTGGIPGGQAEYVRVPYAEVNCLKLPADVPDEKALFLSDIVPTSLYGVEIGGVQKGDTVAIWGLGPIGLLAARWCQIRGAGKVYGIDKVPERLIKARDVLHIETIDFSQQNVVDTLHECCPDGVDVAIEAAGFEYSTSLLHKLERAFKFETDTSDIFVEMFKCVRPFGRVAVIGVYVGTANQFPVGMLMEKALTIRSGQSPTQKYWKYCLDMIQSGEFDPTFVITHRGTLEDGPTFYKQFYKRKDGFIKCFMRVGYPA